MNPLAFGAGTALVLGALVLIALPMLRYRRDSGVGLALIALVVLFPLAVAAVYMQVTSYPWNDPAAVTNEPPPAEAQQAPVDEMIVELAERLKTEPTVEGYVLLGRSYTSLQRYPDAVEAWHRAWELSAGESAEISLGYAEALILADRRTLTTSAADLLEFVLSEQPTDARALWYGGLSSAALGRNAEAISRWTLLLDQELPDNLRTVVQTQLAQLGATVADAPAAGSAAGAPGTVVEATLTIAPELAGQVPPNAALFVFARDANQPGPPIAVKRLRAGEFPVTVRLSDADAMVAGRKIADAAKLKIVARISLQGSAIEAPGDLYGESLPDAGSNPMQVELNIDSVAE